MVSFDPYTAQQQSQQPIIMTTLKIKPLPTAAETAFELEKSQITSYEEGWDRWDGPVWPLGTVQCSLRKYSLTAQTACEQITDECTENPNCTLKPCAVHHPKELAKMMEDEAFEIEKSKITSYEEGWDSWDGPVWPLGTVQCSLQNPNCVLQPCPEHHPATSTPCTTTKNVKTKKEEAFERQKFQIISYEEGWDSWDGPVWPLGTVQCDLQSPDCVLSPCMEHWPAKVSTAGEGEE
jgi:hypothetical protein